VDEEGQLIRRVIDRQPEAEEEFVRRYSGLVLGLARGRFALVNSEADEILQMTMAKLWEQDCRALRAWRGKGKFTSYLTVIVTHLCMRERGRERSRLEQAMDLSELVQVDPSPEPETVLAKRERLRLVEETCLQLAPRDRLLLALRFGDERTPQEMSTVLGMHPGTVRKALHDALRRLRSRLAEKKPGLFESPLGEEVKR
jgi:RNA polymerase sigma factor (sigma-70 family)